MEKKCAVPTFYLYGSGDDGTYDAYSRPDDDGEWCQIDDVTGAISQREAELARLRAENGRLRGVVSATKELIAAMQVVARAAPSGRDDVKIAALAAHHHALQRLLDALAALYQERK